MGRIRPRRRPARAAFLGTKPETIRARGVRVRAHSRPKLSGHVSAAEILCKLAQGSVRDALGLDALGFDAIGVRRETANAGMFGQAVLALFELRDQETHGTQVNLLERARPRRVRE
jgi:hypothetical protein